MRHPFTSSWVFVFAVMGANLGCTPRSAGSGAAAPDDGQALPAVGDPQHNLLKNGTFDDGVMLPWMQSFTVPAAGAAEVKDGALCLRVDSPGANRWDAQIRHREMVVEQGHNYTLSFKAWASRPTRMTGKVGMSGPPYKDYWTRAMDLDTKPQPYGFTFSMKDPTDATVELAFHAGGQMVQGPGPAEICIDDVVLSDPAFVPPPPPAPVVIPDVRVNQQGYLPKAVKVAAWVTDVGEAADWQLVDSSGKVVASGKTTPFGEDAVSGDRLQIIDFTAHALPGQGYVIKVGDSHSDPFAIDDKIYQKLKLDAFKYFYHNRSGIEIKMPFAGEEQWTRPAGHPSDKAPCAPGTGCDYTLDVTGGWYDAGDHGKYVVNGGISAWTLLNWYERSQRLKGGATAFADGRANIPESGNKVNDLLDEARWEVEFLLKMQVPEGKPLAGMVHHKIHDEGWTALGTPPHLDPMKRYLRPPSTAATLNLAAVAAQAARIFAKIDPAFSAQCLKAAEVAWAAAKKNPAKLAPASDSTGGGPYDDKVVKDEFYWAAAELFITTGKPEYQKELASNDLDGSLSPTAGAEGGATTPMTWQRVDALGKISLAVVPSKLSKAEVAKYRSQIQAVADQYVEASQKQGYRVPLDPGKDGKYPWGSNSYVLNNMLDVGQADDFAPKPEYRDTVVLGMDYLLGRNAMGQSYITGYGDRPLQHPHHRFWAHQANANFPAPPPGAVSGGPNSGLEDPYVQAAGLKGCAPQKCFVDNIEAWSTNEITINWNAPLTWVAAWLDEHAKG